MARIAVKDHLVRSLRPIEGRKHHRGLKNEAIATYITNNGPGSALIGRGGERLRAETDTGVSLPVTRAGLTPEEFADLLPQRLNLSSAQHGWDRVTVQRFLYSPSLVEVPGTRDHRLILHLRGPALIEGTCNGRWDRQWSDCGHIGITPAGLPVTRAINGRPEFAHIHLSPALVDEVAAEAFNTDPAQVRLAERLTVADEEIYWIGCLLLAEADEPATGSPFAAEVLTRALAVHLLRRHSSLAPRTPDIPGGGAMMDGRLRRVTEYMRANLAEDLRLAQLASVVGLSPTQFARTFRAATGEPPHRYLVRLRIEQARLLLEQTKLSVIEISLRCGFASSNHFATMFGRLTGMSPRAWRNMRCL